MTRGDFDSLSALVHENLPAVRCHVYTEATLKGHFNITSSGQVQTFQAAQDNPEVFFFSFSFIDQDDGGKVKQVTLYSGNWQIVKHWHRGHLMNVVDIVRLVGTDYVPGEEESYPGYQYYRILL